MIAVGALLLRRLMTGPLRADAHEQAERGRAGSMEGHPARVG